jgi:hypothetical protein
MRRNGARFLCHVIDPAAVRVTPTESGRGLVLDFIGFKALSGTFDFRSSREAAEISLWILGGFASRGSVEHERHMPSRA